MKTVYNRYIPQGDGTYRRNRVEPPQRPPEPVCDPIPVPPIPSHAEPECPPPPPRRPQKQKESKSAPSAGSFLRNLLPKDFDTGDLLIILLLLLMAGDNQEEQNTALLTLALYLFM